jgi:hypothetical protein
MQEQEFLSTGSGAHSLPIQWVLGILSPGLKRPGPEADHSPQSNVKVKNGGAMSHSRIYLHGVVLN